MPAPVAPPMAAPANGLRQAAPTTVPTAAPTTPPPRAPASVLFMQEQPALSSIRLPINNFFMLPPGDQSTLEPQRSKTRLGASGGQEICKSPAFPSSAVEVFQIIKML